MTPFFDATPLLDRPDELRARFDEDGYVFVRQVVDPDVLAGLHADVCEILDDLGWLRAGADPLDAIVDHVPVVEGEDEYFEAYDRITRLQSFHAVPHTEEVSSLMRALLGDSAFPHPLSVCRLVFPENDAWTTPPHQDYPNNQGTPDLLACWMPLVDCPIGLGSISVLPGSHRHGLFPMTWSLGAGNWRCDFDPETEGFEWVGGDFERGDAIVFHSHTVHRSLSNTTEAMRLSVDYRFQREGEPLTIECLQPHFARISWDDIYDGWTGDDLQYYWEDKQFDVVPWNTDLRPPAHELDDKAIRQMMGYNARRGQLARTRGWDPTPSMARALDAVASLMSKESRAAAASPDDDG